MDDMHADAFRPLSAEEVASAAGGGGDEPKVIWEQQMPAPAEPPEMDRLPSWTNGERPHHIKIYRDAQGQPLFAVIRYLLLNKDGTPKLRKDGKRAKDDIPYTYGRLAKTTKGRRTDRTGWHLKRPELPVPLYGLDRLAARPGAPVLLVEGEKAADAAAALFPGHVVMASQGGSGAAKNADWSVLANRDVVIWPDNDKSGVTYAKEATSLLRDAGADAVRTVQVPADWREGWDLADEPENGVVLGDLRRLLDEAPEVIEANEWAEGDGPGAVDDEPPARRPSRPRGARSQSATAYRNGKALVRDGATFDEMVVALRADPETAVWMREKGDMHDGREARRIFEAATLKGPLIRTRGGQLHAEASEGESAIIAAGKPIHQRGNSLVRPAVQQVPASKGRTTQSACLIEVTVHGLIDTLCAVATWERFDGRSGEWVEINPPMAVAQTILSRAGEWRFSRIAGVITTPTLRPDGSILSEHGYDLVTRLFHMKDPDVKLHPAVKSPTRADAEKALKLLLALLNDFPFVDNVSKAVALSGLITPVVRGALSVVPLHAFRANSPGTGKSYLVDVASTISTGRPCPVASASSDEQETDKRIAGMMLAGFPVCSLDNVNGELGSDLLCQATERPLVRIRPLGTSEIIEIENGATIFATGNNLRVRSDMVRRALVCSMDAGVERPELREFKADPVVTVMDNRSQYVSACLIIVRAYAAARRPGLLPQIGSFGDWSDTVRSALVWLGCDDPAQSMEKAREDDPELGLLREIIGAWREAFGVDEYAISEVSKAIEGKEESKMGEPTDYLHPELREVILREFAVRGAVNADRLGMWLRNREGRIVDGFRIIKGKTKTKARSWRWCVAPAPKVEA